MGLWTDILWKLRRPVPPVPDHRRPPQGVVTTFLPPGYTIRGRTDAKDTGCFTQPDESGHGRFDIELEQLCLEGRL